MPLDLDEVLLFLPDINLNQIFWSENFLFSCSMTYLGSWDAYKVLWCSDIKIGTEIRGAASSSKEKPIHLGDDSYELSMGPGGSTGPG